MNSENEILYKDLSYKLQGLFFDIRNDLGSGHKESIYQNALEKELTGAGIRFIKEPPIKVYSKKGEFLGLYRPDFLIEDKIIVELKAVEHISRQETARVYDYLRNSKYELAYFVNFASPRLFIKRLIFTNDRKPGFKSILKSLVVLFVAISLLFVAIRGVNAAELYLETSQPEYAPNETFSVDIRFNVTPPENVTAIEGYLKFDNQSLKALDFLTGNSVLMFIETPKINQEQGIVSFSGIIPGGYTGRLPGDPGESNLLGRIIFQAQKTINPQTNIHFLDNSRVLLDDGKEAKTNLVFKPLDIQISPQEVVFNPLNEWEKAKEEDKIPPEEFKPEIVKINEQYFLVFNSQDKQSGIDHYEVATLKENLLGQLKFISNFGKGESPYPLKEADLNKVIEIKAIDKAGNERIAVVEPGYPVKRYESWQIWFIILIGVIIFYFVIRIPWTRYKIKH